MKITLEFEHSCELIDLLEKFMQCYVLPTAKINTNGNEQIKEYSNVYNGTRIEEE